MDNLELPHDIEALACHPIRCFFSHIRACRRYKFTDDLDISLNIRCVRQLTENSEL